MTTLNIVRKSIHLAVQIARMNDDVKKGNQGKKVCKQIFNADILHVIVSNNEVTIPKIKLYLQPENTQQELMQNVTGRSIKI